jgi:hypothetical protein
VGAGFDKLSVGIKDMGERAPKSMVKCEIELIVKYGIKICRGGFSDQFFHPQITSINPPLPND